MPKLLDYIRDDAPAEIREWAAKVYPGIRTRMPKLDAPPRRLIILAVVRDAEMRLGMKRTQAVVYAARMMHISRMTVWRAVKRRE